MHRKDPEAPSSKNIFAIDIVEDEHDEAALARLSSAQGEPRRKKASRTARKRPPSPTHITEAAVYHEAGHALAIWYTGGTLDSVSAIIGASKATETLGKEVSVHGSTEAFGGYRPMPGLFENLMAVDPTLALYRHDAAMAAMTVMVAGDVAEARALRPSTEPGWPRQGSHRRYDLVLADFPEHLRTRMRLASYFGAKLLMLYGWRAVEDLAQALRDLGTISGGLAEEILHEAWPQVAPIPNIPTQPGRWTSDRRRADMALLEVRK